MEMTNFFKGYVYKATWITDSIKEGVLLDKEDYMFTFSDDKNNFKFKIPSNRAKYTITEAMIVWKIA